MASNSQCDRICCRQTNAHGHSDGGGGCICDGAVCGGKVGKKGYYSAGGYLVGPTHEDGGISGIVDGVEPIEVEGGEFIINAQTVDAVGEEFLHELNSTQTQYHDGGFESGQLPYPSMYERGGPVKKYQKGKKVRKKRSQFNPIGPGVQADPRIGSVGSVGDKCIKHKMPDGSIMRGPVHGPGQICVQWSTTPPSIEDFNPGGQCETDCPEDGDGNIPPCYECCTATQGCGDCCGANCCESVERAGGKVSRKGGKPSTRPKRPGLTTAPSDPLNPEDITWGKCTGEQIRREPPCESMFLQIIGSGGQRAWHCVCPVQEASSNRQGGKVSGIQRFSSGGRVGRSTLGHPIKKG
jgi:hypothetical protein